MTWITLNPTGRPDSGVSGRYPRSTHPEGFDVRLLFRLTRRPVWLLGIASMIGGFAFQLAALRYGGLACPACGREPATRGEALQQGEDLAIVWLHLDADRVTEARHCVACQPHGSASSHVTLRILYRSSSQATLTRNQARFAGAAATVPGAHQPTSEQRQAFDLIGAAIPLALK